MSPEYLEITSVISKLIIELVHYFKPRETIKREFVTPMCSICLEPLCQPTIILNCRHEFHVACIKGKIDEGDNECHLCKKYIYEH